MGTVDFKELAEYCIKRYKDGLNPEKSKYIDTLYVAISSDNKVYCSNTPHIIDKASRLILIHSKSSLANTNWYTWYWLESIDENGQVTDGFLGNGLRLYCNFYGTWSNQVIRLSYGLSYDNSKVLKMWHAPFENKVQDIWDYYCKFKDAKTEKEVILLQSIINNEQKKQEIKTEIESAYKLLEELNEKYKGLLDKINNLIG